MDGRCSTIEFGILVSDNEHRNLGSVFAVVPNLYKGQDFGRTVLRGEMYLVGEEVIWVQAVDKGLSVDTPSFVICLPEVILSDNARGREPNESGEEPFVRATSR